MSKRTRTELRERRQRVTRMQQIGLAVALVVGVVGIAAFFIYTGGQTAGSAPDPGKSVGPADAKVVMRLFSDFQCPYCGKFATLVEQQLVAQYAATGKIRFEYRHYIVVDSIAGGTESHRAAEASECANEQGQFWPYHDYLFAHQNGEAQGAFSDANLKTFAVDLKLDAAQFNACFDSKRYAQKVDQETAWGRTLGVEGTPTIFINGKLMTSILGTTEVNFLDLKQVGAAIDAELARVK